MAGPEAEFQAALVDLCSHVGALTYHTHDSRRSREGFPDLVIVAEPMVLFTELKIPPNRATPAQAEWLERTGACTVVESRLWTPADWPEIESMLTRRPRR